MGQGYCFLQSYQDYLCDDVIALFAVWKSETGRSLFMNAEKTSGWTVLYKVSGYSAPLSCFLLSCKELIACKQQLQVSRGSLFMISFHQSRPQLRDSNMRENKMLSCSMRTSSRQMKVTEGTRKCHQLLYLQSELQLRRSSHDVASSSDRPTNFRVGAVCQQQDL